MFRSTTFIQTCPCTEAASSLVSGMLFILRTLINYLFQNIGHRLLLSTSLFFLNREGVYVSLKLQFNGGDINNLNIFIDFLRDGGGDLLTDKVYLKLGKIGTRI